MKRWIVIISGFGILISVAAILIVITNDKDDSANNTTPAAESNARLEGTGQNTRLDVTDDETTQNAIETMLQYNESDSNITALAVVRKDSVVRSTTTAGSPKVHYLVDIPQLQRTFVVEREGNINSDFSSLYVLCPGPSDLRYPAKACRQIE